MRSWTSSHWWTRPCGGREVFALAAPLVVSTSCWTLMGFTDRMLLLWHSNAAIAAVLPASMLHTTVICLPFGLATYVGTFVAQYYGAQRMRSIGRVTWQGIWLSLAAWAAVLATVPLVPGVIHLAGHPADVAALEATYYRVLSFGTGGLLVSAVLSGLFIGIGRTREVMMIEIASAGLNVVLDYAWILGRLGFPAWGVAGAAWATIVAEGAAAAAYFLLLCRPRFWRTFHLGQGWRFDPALVVRLLRFGGPNGLQGVGEAAVYTLLVLLVGRLGEEALAATNLALSVNNLAWLPVVGLGTAVATLVGQQLGRNRPRLAARATSTASRAALVYTGLVALAFVGAPDLFLIAHASGVGSERFDDLRQVTVTLLQFVAAYCIFDAVNLVFSSALRGAGDTRFVLSATLAVSPWPMVACWIGVAVFGAGLYWCWAMMTLWICTLATVFLVRFLQGRWREMRVIEPEPIGECLDDERYVETHLVYHEAGGEPEPRRAVRLPAGKKRVRKRLLRQVG